MRSNLVIILYFQVYFVIDFGQLSIWVKVSIIHVFCFLSANKLSRGLCFPVTRKTISFEQSYWGSSLGIRLPTSRILSSCFDQILMKLNCFASFSTPLSPGIFLCSKLPTVRWILMQIIHGMDRESMLALTRLPSCNIRIFSIQIKP